MRLLGVLAGAVLALGLAAPQAEASLVLDVGPGGSSQFCDSCGNASGQTFGWVFDVNSTIKVDGLGAWDSNAAPFGRDVQAGLWTDAGTLLASTTISDSSPTEASVGEGNWRVESIATLTLTLGRYVLGMTFFDLTPLAQFGTDFTTVPEITYVGARQSSAGPDSGLSYADITFLNDGVFGPNLQLAELPEPATLAIFGLGLAGLGWAVRRRRIATRVR